jgi:hypothetical protein
MSYLSQIPLNEVREFLRLNDNSNDNVITLMLANACRYFEDKTSRLIYERSKDFIAGCRIYDYPIADTTDLTKKANYYITHADVTLTVGYADGELPDEIKELILTMVEFKFYANEDEGNLDYPNYIKENLQSYKRFYI